MLQALCMYQLLTLAASSLILVNNIDNDNIDTLNVYERVLNLIENITVRQSANMRVWIFVRAPANAASEFELALLTRRPDGVASMHYAPRDYQTLSLPDRRDYAAIFLSSPTNEDDLESWLNVSLKLPPDSIKIFVRQNDCRLNESKLSEIMSKLWHSHDKIGFIYYMSLCAPAASATTATRKSGNSDYGQRPHRNNYIVNLFYYQPFYRHKSVEAAEQQQQPHHRESRKNFGKMEKINLINASNDVDAEWTSASRAFHYFPFAPHKLNFNGYLLTVILFPSTMAYLKSDVDIFKKDLSYAELDEPFHLITAYFGEDVEALLELQRILNFNMNLSPPSDNAYYGFKLENGSFNGALGDLIGRRADFMSNACFVKDYLTDNRLEFTSAINDDKLCIAVRTAALVPSNLLILSLFQRSVWILILITILAVCLSHALLLTLIDGIEYAKSGAPRESQYACFATHFLRRMRNDTNIIFRMIAIIFGVSHLHGFSNSSSIRFFLTICLMWSVVLTGAFTGLLYNVYTTPKSYPNIDTLEDLLKSGLEIHVRHPGLVADIFGDGKDQSTVSLLKRRLRVSDDDFLNLRIVKRGDVAALVRYANYDSANNKLEPREDGVSYLHFVAECPRSYTLAYLLPRRSIYIKPINWYINIFMQSGLTVKWQRDSSFYFKLEHALKSRHQYREMRVKINLHHVELAFLVLIFGFAVSSLVLAIEIFLKRRYRRREIL